MNALKLHNFIREEIMKECELLDDLQLRINYLKEVRAEYITNPPELDENIRRTPRLEIYLEEKIKLIVSELEEETKQKRNTNDKNIKPRKPKNLEEDAYEFVKAYLKFYSIEGNKGKRITYRIIEKYSDNYLSYSSWTSRFKDPVYWVQVEAQRIKKIDSKNVQLETTRNILSEKLRDYIVKEEKKAKLAKHRIAKKNEGETTKSSKFKENQFTKLERDGEDFLDTYSLGDPNPYSQNSEDIYEQLEKNID